MIKKWLMITAELSNYSYLQRALHMVINQLLIINYDLTLKSETADGEYGHKCL